MAANESIHALYSCLFCHSRFENKERLSRHIDLIHHSHDLIKAVFGHADLSHNDKHENYKPQIDT